MSVPYYGDYDTTETVNLPFNTFTSDDPSASVTVTDLAAGDIEIHKDGSTTQRSSDSGVTVSIDFDTVTGNHMVHIDLSDNTDAGYYAAGSRYSVRLEGITVDAGTLNVWIGSFSIGCTLRPVTAGRTVVVDANGLIDANTVKSGPTGSGTAQTANDNGADINAILIDTGTTLDGKIDTIDTNVDTILVDTGTTLDDHLTDIKGTGFVKDTHSLIDIEAYVDLIDDGTSGLAKIATDVAAVLIDTAVIGAAGAGLTAVPWNAAWDAEVESECNDAIVAQKLDHLVAVADADDVVDNSIIAKLANSGATADWSLYVNTTDSLMALRDRGDAAWTTGAGGSPPTVLQNTTITGLASQTVFNLTAGSADDGAYTGAMAVVEDSATSTQKAVGLVKSYTGSTKTITLDEDPGVFTMANGDTIDIIATSRALPEFRPDAAGGLPVSDAGGLDLDIKLANTNEVTAARMGALTDWINGGRLDLIVDAILVDTGTTLDGKIDTIDTNVDSILVDTGTTLQAELDAIQAAVITNAAGADIAADIIAIKAETALILTDTGTTLQAELDGIQADTEDIQTQIGTAGAGLTDLGGMSVGMKAEVESEATDSLNAYDPPTKAEMDTGHGLLATEAKQDIIDTNIDQIETAVITNAAGTDIAADIIAIKAETAAIVNDTDLIDDGTSGLAKIATDVAAILVDTAVIGAAGAGLTAIPWNAAWDAEVESEVNDALVAIHLDHLLAVDYDPASKPGTATALLNEVVESDAGVSRFTANALEQAPDAGTGSGLTAIPWNPAWDAEVESECRDAMDIINLDHLFANAMVAGDAVTNSFAARLTSKSATANFSDFDNTTDSLQAIRDKLTDIETDTAEIGAAGAGLTAVPWNASWDAEVQSEVDDALVALHLDHLLAVDYDPASKPGVATALLNELVEDDGGVSRFTANALEQCPGGGDGSGFTAIPWNASWDTEVQSEVNDGLVALGLDHLLAASVAGADVTDNSIIAKLVSKSATADWDDFVNTTDSLQAIKDTHADDVLDEDFEGTTTLRQFLRVAASALYGKLSGAATNTVLFRDEADSKDRITATTDANGNRTAISLDKTA